MKAFFSPLAVRAVLAAVLTALVAGTSGCLAVAAGAAGAGTVAYIRGELDTTLTSSLANVDGAANRALQELQFVKVNESKDALAAIITARTAQDKKITLTLTKVADNLTRVQIRVGMFGDETISRAILDRITAKT